MFVVDVLLMIVVTHCKALIVFVSRSLRQVLLLVRICFEITTLLMVFSVTTLYIFEML
jgi:hypothetical protein